MIAVLNIGTELLIGKVINTNLHAISLYLQNRGEQADLQISCHDEEEQIRDCLHFLKDYELILVTGGLGETHDDITERMFDRHYPHEHKSYFKNLIGTAPGVIYQGQQGCAILFPGPPVENSKMLPVIDQFLHQAIASRQYHVTGYRETDIEAKLRPYLPDSAFATYTNVGFTTVRILSRDYDELMVELFGDALVSTDEDTIESVLFKLLEKHELTVATVESITGGMMVSRLTDLSGASRFIYGNITPYMTRAKSELLHVEPAFLEQHTAVSMETSKQLAEQMRAMCSADLVLAVTGYADHSDEDLHGRSYLYCLCDKGFLSLEVKYPWTRERIRARVSFAGLDLIRKTILHFYENKV